MKDILDLHTHTIASGHAYNTMNEMIAAAKLRGLEIYGITEHAPRMNGSCTEMYFQNFRILPREKDGMTVLHGVELNILDAEGHVDLTESACGDGHWNCKYASAVLYKRRDCGKYKSLSECDEKSICQHYRTS